MGCIFHEPQRSPARRDVTVSEMKRAEIITRPHDVVLNATALLHAARVFKHWHPLNYRVPRSERVMSYDAPAAAVF